MPAGNVSCPQVWRIRRAVGALRHHGVRTVHHVKKKLLGASQSRDVVINALQRAGDQTDPGVAVTCAELVDLGQGEPGTLTKPDQTGAAQQLLVVPAVARSGPQRREDSDILPVAQHVRLDPDGRGRSSHRDRLVMAIRPFLTSG